jgi:hypothetical protein
MTSQYLFVITYCYLILRDVRRYTYLRYEQLTCWLVGFNVNNLESVCSELEKKEVKFYKKLTEEPFGKHAIIKDPDGHLIFNFINRDNFKSRRRIYQIPCYHGFAPPA